MVVADAVNYTKKSDHILEFRYWYALAIVFCRPMATLHLMKVVACIQTGNARNSMSSSYGIVVVMCKIQLYNHWSKLNIVKLGLVI